MISAKAVKKYAGRKEGEITVHTVPLTHPDLARISRKPQYAIKIIGIIYTREK